MTVCYNLDHCFEVFSCLLLCQVALGDNPVKQLASIADFEDKVHMSLVLKGPFQLCNVWMVTDKMKNLDFLKEIGHRWEPSLADGCNQVSISHVLSSASQQSCTLVSIRNAHPLHIFYVFFAYELGFRDRLASVKLACFLVNSLVDSSKGTFTEHRSNTVVV